MRFHETSVLTELEVGVDYAVGLKQYPQQFFYMNQAAIEADLKRISTRPVKLTVTMIGTVELPVIVDPDQKPDEITINTEDVEIIVYGKWTDPRSEWSNWSWDPEGFMRVYPIPDPTWEQYAAQQYGQVLRQRGLAARLTRAGIPREPDPYLPFKRRLHVGYDPRSLTLNFDELDYVLTKAGYPA